MPAAWSSARRRRRCSRKCGCPTPRRCSRRSRRSTPRRTRRCRRSRGGRPIRRGRCQGCSFSPRCRYADGRLPSAKSRRSADAESPEHQYACFHPIETARRRRRMMQQASTSASREPLLDVDNLVVEYPVGGKTVHAVSGVSLADRPRRDARAGRRVRLRQVDARPRGAAVAPAGLRAGAVRRPRSHGDAGRCACGRCASACS